MLSRREIRPRRPGPRTVGRRPLGRTRNLRPPTDNRSSGNFSPSSSSNRKVAPPPPNRPVFVESRPSRNSVLVRPTITISPAARKRKKGGGGWGSRKYDAIERERNQVNETKKGEEKSTTVPPLSVTRINSKPGPTVQRPVD